MDKYKKKYILYHPQTIIQLSISLQTTNCVNIPSQTIKKNANVPHSPAKTNKKTKMTNFFRIRQKCPYEFQKKTNRNYYYFF
jgi:broad specificity polyphosphatase/5'/3'-nucleotidase SurE